jgi:Holliday junction resolvase RusA-like endonuclease
MTLEFRVFGVAQPKGSMKAFYRPGMKAPIVTDSNRSAKSWAQLVAEGANHALAQRPPEERGVLDGPVRLTLAFYLPRPKKYQRRRGIDPAHVTKPDASKLVRGVEDALTQVVYRDDAQIVELVVTKRYAALEAAPHVYIRVERTAGVAALHVRCPAAAVRGGGDI